MAMEQYIHDSVSQNGNKEDDTSFTKWKSSSESVNESVDGPSGGFDCNICLETVQDPVVTYCGHLYCWPCIYVWIDHQRTRKEYIDKKNAQCPVCKSEVSEDTIVTLYGHGKTTESLSEEKGLNIGVTIPRKPPSPRSNGQTSPAQQANHRSYLHAHMPIAMNVISPTSPTIGEIVYERFFGNSPSTLYAYPNSYNLGTQRVRRQAMQAERSLSRISFFLLCCVMLCLLLF